MQPNEEQKKAAEELGRGLEAHYVVIEGFRQFARDNHDNKPERERYHKLAEKAFADMEAWVASREAQGAENAARVVLEAVEATPKYSTDLDCVEAARAAAAQFMKKDE